MTAKELNQKLLAGGARFLGPVVVTAREKAITQTKSGLLLPGNVQVKQQFGAIVAFGDQSDGPARGLEVGDAIYIPAYGGVIMKQKVGDKVYTVEILYDKDILLAYKTDREVELEDEGSLTTSPLEGMMPK